MGAFRDDLLPQAGGADMTAGPGGACHSGVDHGAVGGLAGDIHIADSFAGQGQGLGIRVADDGVRVDGGQEGLMKRLNY